MRHLCWAGVVLVGITVAAARGETATKVCGVYTSVAEFASRAALDRAANDPAFSEKHRRMLDAIHPDDNAAVARACGFDTLFMTLYPLWGSPWWDDPAARGLVQSALEQTKGRFRVHLGLSLLNGNFVSDLHRYPGACQTVQCDGTRPQSVCYYEDALWADYARNVIEMIKLGQETSNLAGVFLDPEGYAGESYDCFCDHCVRKFDAWAHVDMPPGLVKPDSWLRARGLFGKFEQWRATEVHRHAEHLRQVIRAQGGGADLQLASLLWDYPVAVGQHDARATYFQQLCISLGTPDKPAWTMPEHAYYSDAADLKRIIEQVRTDLSGLGAGKSVRVLPGIRLLRRPASSLRARGQVLRDADVPGYWMYELADLRGKTPIEFEGHLTDPPAAYVKALAEMNTLLRGR